MLIGLENQTKVDENMVFRVAGYDGAYYRAQLTENKKERYPVATIVLYFGMDRWKGATSLYDAVSIPKEMKAYINDYKIYVFEIAYLTEELEEDEAVIREIYDIALAFAPDYDCNAIYEAWKAKQE